MHLILVLVLVLVLVLEDGIEITERNKNCVVHGLDGHSSWAQIVLQSTLLLAKHESSSFDESGVIEVLILVSKMVFQPSPKE